MRQAPLGSRASRGAAGHRHEVSTRQAASASARRRAQANRHAMQARSASGSEAQRTGALGERPDQGKELAQERVPDQARAPRACAWARQARELPGVHARQAQAQQTLLAPAAPAAHCVHRPAHGALLGGRPAHRQHAPLGAQDRPREAWAGPVRHSPLPRARRPPMPPSASRSAPRHGMPQTPAPGDLAAWCSHLHANCRRPKRCALRARPSPHHAPV